VASAATIGRRALALVLGWVCVALILVGAILQTTEGLVGTPRRFAATVVATASTPSVERSLAASAVNELAANSNSAVRLAVRQHRGLLEDAFVDTMNNKKVLRDARAVVARLYRAGSSSGSQAINLRPLIVLFTTALHDADARVPRIPAGLAPQIEVKAKGLKTVGSISKSLGTIAWLGLLAGLLGAVLIARLLIRGHRKQLWSVGTIIGEPAVGLLVIAELGRHAISVIHIGSNTGRLLVASLVSRVAGALARMALLLLVVDLAVLMTWQALSMYRRRRPSTSSTHPSRSSSETFA
jgi:hypothetical protein